MPKIMEPSKYIKVENVRKREAGHDYFSPDGMKWMNFNPGWYWYAYRPIKHGPFPNAEAAMNAGIEATLAKRAKSDDT